MPGVHGGSQVLCPVWGGGVFLARGITESQVKAASQEEGVADLTMIEDFLGRLIRAVDPSTSNGAALKAVAALLSRAGQLILRPRPSGVDGDDFAKAELKFRRDLSEAGVDSLPPVILETTQKFIDQAEQGTASKGLPARTGPTPSGAAALAFDAEGALVEHLTYKANQRGIEQGGRVRCVKAIAGKACRTGVEVGREGRVQAFKAALVQVLWDVDEGGSPVSTPVSLASIEPLPQEVAGHSRRRLPARPEPLPQEVSHPSPPTWQLCDGAAASHYLVVVLQSTLFHLHCTCGAGPKLIKRGCEPGVRAVIDLDPLAVSLIPYFQDDLGRAACEGSVCSGLCPDQGERGVGLLHLQAAPTPQPGRGPAAVRTGGPGRRRMDSVLGGHSCIAWQLDRARAPDRHERPGAGGGGGIRGIAEEVPHLHPHPLPEERLRHQGRAAHVRTCDHPT